MLEEDVRVTWSLTCGDCLDPVTGMATLADGSVDHVITDPPYDEHTHNCGRRGTINAYSRLRDNRERTRVLGFDAITSDQMAGAAVQFARVTRRWVLVFCAMEMIAEWRSHLKSVGLEPVRVGLWLKSGSTPQFSGDRPAVGAEAIVIAHRPGRKHWNGGGKHGVWECPIVLDRAHEGGRVHTTQKPLALMEALVRDFTDPGELVLDPFAGSGTTGVAARRLGRRFVGWELDAKYAEVARRRIGETTEQTTLALERRPREKQTALALGGTE